MEKFKLFQIKAHEPERYGCVVLGDDIAYMPFIYHSGRPPIDLQEYHLNKVLDPTDQNKNNKNEPPDSCVNKNQISNRKN